MSPSRTSKDTKAALPALSANERMILDIVRRNEPIVRSGITGHTNLTQQSVHRLVEGLMERRLLRAGPAPRGTRGQPSPSIELARDAAYSVGLSVNTDAVTLVLADFSCSVVAERRLSSPPRDREATLSALSDLLDEMLAENGIERSRLVGLGFSMSGFFISERREFNAPEQLRQWSLIDLRPILSDRFKLPVWVENNATTGAIGESLSGAGLWCSNFAYLSFNYGFGGGIILDGQPYHGFHGNAAEVSGIYDPHESENRPALQYLLQILQDEGLPLAGIEDLRRQFDPSWPGVETWLQRTMPMLDRVIATLIAVLDPQAIVFGGQLPPALGEMMMARARMPSRRQHRYGVGPPEARLVLSQIEGDAAAIGVALLPLKFTYFL